MNEYSCKVFLFLQFLNFIKQIITATIKPLPVTIMYCTVFYNMHI